LDEYVYRSALPARNQYAALICRHICIKIWHADLPDVAPFAEPLIFRPAPWEAILRHNLIAALLRPRPRRRNFVRSDCLADFERARPSMVGTSTFAPKPRPRSALMRYYAVAVEKGVPSTRVVI
jgi:hypothetical protein